MEAKLINIIQEICDKAKNYIGDDCAIMEFGDAKLLACLDNFVEATHFDLSYFSPEDIGWKALAVNISDIAAMAGKPLFALVGLSLSEKIADKETWLRQFYQGMNDCAQKHGNLKIIGGDICSSKSLSAISVTVLGQAPKQDFLRSQAQPGDLICVTGKFGNSHNYFKNKLELDKPYHLRPVPRLKESQSLLKANERGALIDASDGLAMSLIEIAKQSNVDIEISPELIPMDDHIDINMALYGGEDYELVASVENPGSDFKVIGKVLSVDTHPQVRVGGEVLDPQFSYQHFNKDS